MTTYRYSFTQRLLHWLIALLVFGLLCSGFLFWAFGYEALTQLTGSEDNTSQLFMYHKSIGLLVMVLMILRLMLRFKEPAPAYNPPLSFPQRMVGGGIHLALYLLLIGLPIGGWLATSAAGYSVSFFGAFELPALVGKDKELSTMLFGFHGLGGLIVAALLLVHIAAALKHRRLRDGVMDRISLP